MKRTSLYLCVILSAALMLLASCGPAEPPGVSPPEGARKMHAIKIHIAADQIKVTPNAPVLRRSAGDQAQWEITPPKLSFKVKFNKPGGSPFDSVEFDNTNNSSGDITATPEPDGSGQCFGYSVEVEGYETLDPGIIIIP